MTTDTLTIDWTQGELRVPHTLMVTLDQMTFEGSDVTARFDPVSNDLLFAHVANTKQLVVTPQSVQALGAQQPSTAAANIPQGAQQPASAINDASSSKGVLTRIESLFRLSATGNVRIVQGSRSLTTPSLSGWMRLVDGAIPRPLASPARSAGKTAQENANTSGSDSTTTATSTPTPLASSDEQQPSSKSRTTDNTPIVASWTGPLEVRRLPASPTELENDDLWLSAAAPTPDAPNVVIADDAIGITATGRLATIAATQGEFTLQTPPGAANAQADAGELLLKGLGKMRAVTLRANLASNTAQATGAGQLALQSNEGAVPLQGMLGTSTPSQTSSEQTAKTQDAGTIRWSRGAEFTFVPAADGLPASITKAQFVGDVRAENEAAVIEGDSLIAAFADRIDAAGKATPELRDVWVQGQAALRAKPRAIDASNASTNEQTGWLRAHLVHARFESTKNAQGRVQPTAAQLSASGQVRVDQQGQSVRCDDLLVDFLTPEQLAAQEAIAAKQGTSEEQQAASPAAKLTLGEIARLQATGNVEVESTRDGMFARAHQIIAVPREQTYLLTSEAADQGYAPVLAIKDGASVLAPQIAINIAQREMHASGPGTIGYGIDSLPNQASMPTDAPTAQGSFSQKLSVYEALGKATLTGDATIRYASAPGTLQTLKAPQLDVAFYPAESRPQTNTTSGLRTVAAGSITNESSEANSASPIVQATTQTFVKRDATPRVMLAMSESELAAEPAAQFLSLTSTSMLADIETSTLRVPAAGTLRVADLSQPRELDQPQAQPQQEQLKEDGVANILNAQAGNIASFRWTESLVLEPQASNTQGLAGQSLAATMKGNVRMVRVETVLEGSAQTRSLTELSCEKLLASFSTASLDATPADGSATGASPPAPQPSQRDQLRSVQATTNVWARTQGRELTAASLTFDPATGQIDATGEQTLPVALSNPGGTPLLAQRVLWNTRTGRVDILQPMATAAP
jgi:hypothetical protein